MGPPSRMDRRQASFRSETIFPIPRGGIDRQRVLPFGSLADVPAAVMRVRAALDDGRGGVIAQCERGNRDPVENVAVVFAAWEEPLPTRST